MKNIHIRLILFSLIIYAYNWLHEFGGHYFVHLLSGISKEQKEIRWKGPFKINISPVAVIVLDGEIPKITYFTGGFVPGLIYLILSIILFWRLKGKKKQEQYWGFFALALGLSGVGFTEFVVEGFFTKYHGGVVEIALAGSFILFPLLIIIWPFLNQILDLVKKP